jgi:hypothetical protein
MSAMKKVHRCTSLPSFDIMELKRIREAIFANCWEGRINPMKTGLMRVMMWTQVMWQFATFGSATLCHVSVSSSLCFSPRIWAANNRFKWKRWFCSSSFERWCRVMLTTLIGVSL